MIVEEPNYSRRKLLEFQEKYNIHTVDLFDYLGRLGTTPIEISEKELALWRHYYNIFRLAGGKLHELGGLWK